MLLRWQYEKNTRQAILSYTYTRHLLQLKHHYITAILLLLKHSADICLKRRG
jgi:hypothetical protein